MKKLFLLTACVATATLMSCTGKESDYQANHQSVQPWEYDETPALNKEGNENVVMEYCDDELIDAQKTPRRSVYNAHSIYAGDVDDPLIQQLVDELWDEIEDLERLDKEAARDAKKTMHSTDNGTPATPAEHSEETKEPAPNTGE